MGYEELGDLSVETGNSWKSLASLLHFDHEEMLYIDAENLSMRDKAYRMFCGWKVQYGSAASYRVLHDALCHPLVNRRDLAEKFCTYPSSPLVST